MTTDTTPRPDVTDRDRDAGDTVSVPDIGRIEESAPETLDRLRALLAGPRSDVRTSVQHLLPLPSPI